MIDMDYVKQNAIDYINDNEFTWTEWGYDPISPVYHPIFELYKVYTGSSGIPQTYLIDADGHLRYAKLGMISDKSIIITVLEELLP